jgi:hypothetical protein
LRVIEVAQRQRDEDRLKNKRMTLREKDKLRKAMGHSDLPVQRRRPGKPPTYPPMQLSAADTTVDLLARVLAWAKAQDPQS